MTEKIFASLAEKKAFEKRKAQEISKWIIANLERPIEIAHLMEASGLTQFELIRIFATYFKTTPMQWIRQQKELFNQEKPTQEIQENLQPEITSTPYIPENLRKK